MSTAKTLEKLLCCCESKAGYNRSSYEILAESSIKTIPSGTIHSLAIAVQGVGVTLSINGGMAVEIAPTGVEYVFGGLNEYSYEIATPAGSTAVISTTS